MLGSLFHPASYLGFFLFIAATGCGLPIPEEAAIVVAGVLSAQGQLNVWIAFAACLAGAIVGDSFMYAIGYRWGHRLFTSHHRFAKLLDEGNEVQFHKQLDSHALKIMMIARFLIGIRAPVYVMTGAIRMPYRRFIVYDVISASLVVGTVFWLSYMFGANVQEWIHHAEFIATLIVLAVIAIVGGILYYMNRQAVLEFIFGSDSPSDGHTSQVEVEGKPSGDGENQGPAQKADGASSNHDTTAPSREPNTVASVNHNQEHEVVSSQLGAQPVPPSRENP